MTSRDRARVAGCVRGRHCLHHRRKRVDAMTPDHVYGRRRTTLLGHAINVATWPLTRLIAAWDAADQKLADTYARMDRDDDE